VRTTLDIDDDVLLAAKERARREGRSVGSVVSTLARQALTSSSQPGHAGKQLYGFRPLPKRGGVVTTQLVHDLMDESEE
jgi:hypothetical protein